MIQCTMCEKLLHNRTDTFGEWNYPLCWDCYADTNSQLWGDYYGLAPHTHQYDESGDVILGSTTFEPLPTPNADGDYEIGNLLYSPGPDAGIGFWSRKPLLGWR